MPAYTRPFARLFSPSTWVSRSPQFTACCERTILNGGRAEEPVCLLSMAYGSRPTNSDCHRSVGSHLPSSGRDPTAPLAMCSVRCPGLTNATFLPRFGFVPQLTPQSDLVQPAWLVQDLPPLVQPGREQVRRFQRLLLMLIDWIHQYQVWMAESVGVAYRKETLRRWDEK